MLKQSTLRRSFSLVFVEDSDEDRYALRRMLQQNCPDLMNDLREANTGDQGLALCRERMPDCILLDYGLGDTDGISFLAELMRAGMPKRTLHVLW